MGGEEQGEPARGAPSISQLIIFYVRPARARAILEFGESESPELFARQGNEMERYFAAASRPPFVSSAGLSPGSRRFVCPRVWPESSFSEPARLDQPA